MRLTISKDFAADALLVLLGLGVVGGWLLVLGHAAGRW